VACRWWSSAWGGPHPTDGLRRFRRPGVTEINALGTGEFVVLSEE
jgi:hypothetical protein